MDALVEYTVFVGGKKRRVKLLRVNQDNEAKIELDGKIVDVTYPMGFDFDFETPTLMIIDGKSHKVGLNRGTNAKGFRAEVDRKAFYLQVEEERRILNSKTTTSSSIISPSLMLKREQTTSVKTDTLTSLMPGKVVLLKVKIGDKVKAGDTLCVLEAMKMENEIVAARDGTIAQVMVEQGSIVDKDDVLMVIEYLANK